MSLWEGSVLSSIFVLYFENGSNLDYATAPVRNLSESEDTFVKILDC